MQIDCLFQTDILNQELDTAISKPHPDIAEEIVVFIWIQMASIFFAGQEIELPPLFPYQPYVQVFHVVSNPLLVVHQALDSLPSLVLLKMNVKVKLIKNKS